MVEFTPALEFTFSSQSALPKQGGKLPNDTEALDKHIVSFSEQLRKRNTRLSQAVIFVLKNQYNIEKEVHVL